MWKFPEISGGKFCHDTVIVVITAVLECDRTEVLVTLTTDVGKLLSKLNQVRPKGNINFVSAVRIAHVGNTVYF